MFASTCVSKDFMVPKEKSTDMMSKKSGCGYVKVYKIRTKYASSDCRCIQTPVISDKFWSKEYMFETLWTVKEFKQ